MSNHPLFVVAAGIALLILIVLLAARISGVWGRENETEMREMQEEITVVAASYPDPETGINPPGRVFDSRSYPLPAGIDDLGAGTTELEVMEWLGKVRDPIESAYTRNAEFMAAHHADAELVQAWLDAGGYGELPSHPAWARETLENTGLIPAADHIEELAA